jgi:TRAP-type C4-dicarboxylate transport system permease small subunit
MDNRIYRWVIKLVMLIAIIGIGLSVLFTAYELIMRQLFVRPTIWTNEITSYLLVWFGLLGIAYAYDENAHVSVDLVYNRLGAKSKMLCTCLESLLSLGFMVLLCYYGYNYWWLAYSRGWNHTGSIDVPMSYTRLAIPLIGALLSFQTAFRAWNAIRQFVSDNSSKVERTV